MNVYQIKVQEVLARLVTIKAEYYLNMAKVG